MANNRKFLRADNLPLLISDRCDPKMHRNAMAVFMPEKTLGFADFSVMDCRREGASRYANVQNTKRKAVLVEESQIFPQVGDGEGMSQSPGADIEAAVGGKRAPMLFRFRG